jgi:hypothetical protein
MILRVEASTQQEPVLSEACNPQVGCVKTRKKAGGVDGHEGEKGKGKAVAVEGGNVVELRAPLVFPALKKGARK